VTRPAGSGPQLLHARLPQLLARVQALLAQVPAGERRVLGLTGAPGAGKSTLAAALAGALGEQAGLVPMDGFHLANAELARLGRRQRKGAPDTFDVDGYAALLGRLRRRAAGVVYAPQFDRQLEESIGSAVAIGPDAPLIVTEGNYLLLDQPAWRQVRAACDEVWYLELPEQLRLPRLLERHVAFGKAPDEAERWVAQVDQQNAALIAAGRAQADLIVVLDDAPATP
jgi:pantothenate kinase